MTLYTALPIKLDIWKNNFIFYHSEETMRMICPKIAQSNSTTSYMFVLIILNWYRLQYIPLPTSKFIKNINTCIVSFHYSNLSTSIQKAGKLLILILNRQKIQKARQRYAKIFKLKHISRNDHRSISIIIKQFIISIPRHLDFFF